MNRILIVRLGSLGDVVHGIPVAAALRERFPSARIDWLVDPRYVELVQLVTAVDAAIPADPRALLSLSRAREAMRTLRELRRARYDAVLDLQGLLKSAVLARLAGARRVLGFPRAHLREPLAALFYTQTPDPGAARHVVYKNLSLLAPLGIRERRVRLPLRDVESAVAREVTERFGPSGFALVNPGAAWPNKRWPTAAFAETAIGIRDTYGLRSLVLWGPGEESLARDVVAGAGGSADAAPPTSLTDVLAIARAARLMISGDTGPMHLAAAVGTPIVGLFGPTSPERNGPWALYDVTISRLEECRCVYERRCRLAAPCIESIGVDEVLQAVERRLTAHG